MTKETAWKIWIELLKELEKHNSNINIGHNKVGGDYAKLIFDIANKST